MPLPRTTFMRALLLLAVALGAAIGGAWFARSLDEPPSLVAGTWLDRPRPIERFRLTDDHGLPFGNERLSGAPSLVYFGFTNCPDVCPTTLATLSQILKAKPLPGLHVIFVTVDPERDSPAALKRYVSAFGPEFIGLTGPASALSPLTHSLSVAAERVALPGGGYTMDHSAAVYVIDARGRFVAVFTPPFSAKQMTADLASLRRRLGP